MKLNTFYSIGILTTALFLVSCASPEAKAKRDAAAREQQARLVFALKQLRVGMSPREVGALGILGFMTQDELEHLALNGGPVNINYGSYGLSFNSSGLVDWFPKF